MSIFPTKILLATDNSVEATLAAKVAAKIVDKIDSDLHIVYVRPRVVPHYPGFYVGPEVVQNAQQKEQKMLDREAQGLLDIQVKEVRAAGGSVAQTHLRVGRPDEEIVALSEELGADLVVIGARGWGGIRRIVMGSVSESVVTHAHCSVLVVRGDENGESVFPSGKRILLASDGSEEAELALQMVVNLANSTSSELHVVTVSMPNLPEYVELLEETYRRLGREGQQTLDEQVKKIEEAGGNVTKAHLTMEGGPGQEIIALAEEIGAGLIVVGSRGYGRLRRALIGSVSELVVQRAHCPVLVVRKEKHYDGIGHEAQNTPT